MSPNFEQKLDFTVSQIVRANYGTHISLAFFFVNVVTSNSIFCQLVK